MENFKSMPAWVGTRYAEKEGAVPRGRLGSLRLWRLTHNCSQREGVGSWVTCFLETDIQSQGTVTDGMRLTFQGLSLEPGLQ